MHRSRCFLLLPVLLLSSAATPAIAQFGGGGFGGGGFSSASVSSVRAGICPAPEAIIVEEFYNYHFHDIPTPADGSVVQLDARWGNPKVNRGSTIAYLQVGLATKRDIDLDEVRPLNIAFVIDASGSMRGSRISKVKKSLLTALEKIREFDRVSIVTFNDDAMTVFAPQPAGDQSLLKLAIEGISANGGTNLCGGLLRGYELVHRNFDPRHNNRVVLLTDGNANVGVSDPEQIARRSKEFNLKGIDLSTIGVGHDFNHDLMRQLAESGHGLIHFVADDRDIRKVFVEELEGLLSAVAREVTVTIDYPVGLRVDHVYGYSPRVFDGQLHFNLNPLNAGTTQVLLMKFRVDKSLPRSMELPVSVQLKYREIESGKLQVVEETVPLAFHAEIQRRTNALVDSSVRRNVSIADIASGIREMSRLLSKDKPKTASHHLREQLRMVDRRFPMTLDAEVARTKEIATDYLDKLREETE